MRNKARLRWLVLLSAIITCPRLAHSQEPALRDKIQGEWSRANGNSRFVIKGNTYTEYRSNAPLKVHTTGKVQYPQGKDYAVATLENKWTIWIFSAGKDSLAVEAFRPSGELGGQGAILYRHDSKIENK